MRQLAMLGVVLIGCGYQPGSFHAPGYTFGPARATIGCVDVAIERRTGVDGEPSRSAVLAYAFGNGCDHPAMVDLGAARVVGHDAHGQPVTLTAYDPEREIRAAMLDGRTVGHEAIAYSAEVVVRDVCVDVAAIAHGDGERWMCVAPIAEEVP
jgi:hypothetical protein